MSVHEHNCWSIHCDVCGESLDHGGGGELHIPAGDTGQIVEQLRCQEWEEKGDGAHICASCIEDARPELKAI